MFVFRNTLGFKPHTRLMGPLDGINLDFGGGGTNAPDINGGDNKGGNKDGDGTDPEPPSNKDGDGDGKDGDGTDGDELVHRRPRGAVDSDHRSRARQGWRRAGPRGRRAGR